MILTSWDILVVGCVVWFEVEAFPSGAPVYLNRDELCEPGLPGSRVDLEETTWIEFFLHQESTVWRSVRKKDFLSIIGFDWNTIWSNYSDLTWPHPKSWFSKGNPLISGKSRLVKYYNLARYNALMVTIKTEYTPWGSTARPLKKKGG